jgi:YHS domain-containing protein
VTSRASLILAIALLTAIAGGCARRPAQAAPAQDPGVRTIEQADELPTIPLPTDSAQAGRKAPATNPSDLPFTPAISMDPVDGGKVSITPATPVAEFKDRLYYFQNEENRDAFVRNPEKYARGSLSRY